MRSVLASSDCYTPILKLKTFQVKENKGIVICFHVFIVVQACPPLGRNSFGRFFFILSIQAQICAKEDMWILTFLSSKDISDQKNRTNKPNC